MDNAIKHNSLENVDNIYSNKEYIDKYMDSERLSFYDKIIKTLIDNNVILDNKSIADFGSGTGHLLEKITRKFYNINGLGLEFSKEAICRSKEYFPKIDFIEHNIYDIYEDKKFDVIFCTEVLEHLEYPQKALNNILRTLNKNGIAIITVPNGRIDTFEGHINFWSPESFKIFISDHVKNTINIFPPLTNNKNLMTIIHKFNEN